MGNTQTHNVGNPVNKAQNIPYIVTKTMDGFDLGKFLGNWYEISHTNSVGNVSCTKNKMEYSRVVGQDPNGDQVVWIKAVNRCFQEGQQVSEVEGRIFTTNPQTPSKMKIRWSGKNGLYDLWVYWTDYENSAIAGNGKGLYFILSRQEKMAYCELEKVFITLNTITGNPQGHKSMTLSSDTLKSCS